MITVIIPILQMIQLRLVSGRARIQGQVCPTPEPKFSAIVLNRISILGSMDTVFSALCGVFSRWKLQRRPMEIDGRAKKADSPWVGIQPAPRHP